MKRLIILAALLLLAFTPVLALLTLHGIRVCGTNHNCSIIDDDICPETFCNPLYYNCVCSPADIDCDDEYPVVSDDAQLWYRGYGTVIITCTDGGLPCSQVKYCNASSLCVPTTVLSGPPYLVGVSSAQDGMRIYYNGTDGVGKMSTGQSVVMSFDGIAPDTTDTGTGWHTASFQLTLTCTDTGSPSISGCRNFTYCQSDASYSSCSPVTPGVYGGGAGTPRNTTFLVTATSYWKYASSDAVGNTEPYNNVQVMIDPTAPNTQWTYPQNNQWTNITPQITFTCTDTGGSGCLPPTPIHVCYPGCTDMASGVLSWTPATDGTTAVSYYSTDVAGNVETTRNDINVLYDSSPPPAPSNLQIVNGHIGAGGYIWVLKGLPNTLVTASWDVVTDISTPTITYPNFIETMGGFAMTVTSYPSTNRTTRSVALTQFAQYLFNVRAKNAAGMNGSAVTLSFRPDGTAPVFGSWTPPAAKQRGQSFTFGIPVSDQGSGFAANAPCTPELVGTPNCSASLLFTGGTVINGVSCNGTITLNSNAGCSTPVSFAMSTADIVGNSATSQTYTVQLDNQAPTYEWITPQGQTYGQGQLFAVTAIVTDLGGAGIADNAPCNLVISSAVNYVNDTEVRYNISSGQCDGMIHITDGGSSDGVHTLTLTVADTVGNQQTSATTTITYMAVNTFPGCGPVDFLRNDPARQYASGTTMYYNNNGDDDSFTVVANAYGRGGQPWTQLTWPDVFSSDGGVTPASTQTRPYSYVANQAYASGVETITVSNAVPQTSTCTFNVQQDITAPSASIGSPAANACVRSGIIFFSGSASDTGAGMSQQTCILILDGDNNLVTGDPTSSSGGQSITCTGDITIEPTATNDYDLELQVQDRVGNVQTTTRTIGVDNTKPTIAVAPTVTGNVYGSIFAGTTINISAPVTNPGCMATTCEYTLDGGDTWSLGNYAEGLCKASDIDVSGFSQINVQVRASDANGASTSEVTTLTRDLTPPTCSITDIRSFTPTVFPETLVPPDPLQFWYHADNGSITASVFANDQQTGIQSITFPPMMVPGNTSMQTSYAYTWDNVPGIFLGRVLCTNNVGMTAESELMTFDTDSNPPSITGLSYTPPVRDGFTPTTFLATSIVDGESGVSSSNLSISVDGTPLAQQVFNPLGTVAGPFSPEATVQYTVTARDNVGNTRSVTAFMGTCLGGNTSIGSLCYYGSASDACNVTTSCDGNNECSGTCGTERCRFNGSSYDWGVSFPSETSCFDGHDNDCDGDVDCDDADCYCGTPVMTITPNPARTGDSITFRVQAYNPSVTIITIKNSTDCTGGYVCAYETTAQYCTGTAPAIEGIDNIFDYAACDQLGQFITNNTLTVDVVCTDLNESSFQPGGSPSCNHCYDYIGGNPYAIGDQDGNQDHWSSIDADKCDKACNPSLERTIQPGEYLDGSVEVNGTRLEINCMDGIDNNCDGLIDNTDDNCNVNNHGIGILRMRVLDLNSNALGGRINVTIYPPPPVPQQSVEANGSGLAVFVDIPAMTYYVSARKEGYPTVRKAVTIHVSPPATWDALYLSLYGCDATCADFEFRCNRECAGITNGTDNCTFSSNEVMNACDGRLRGTILLLNYSGNESTFVNCCEGQPYTIITPPAFIQGTMDNLIKYTRIVNYETSTARLVVVTW